VLRGPGGHYVPLLFSTAFSLHATPRGKAVCLSGAETFAAFEEARCFENGSIRSLRLVEITSSLRTLRFAICLLAAFNLTSCIEWTTNSQGELQSIGVPGVPVWQSQTLAEQKRLASEGTLDTLPGSMVDAEAERLLAVQSDADWLTEVNYWRTEAGTQPVGENTGLSLGATEHARYLVKNGPKDPYNFFRYIQTIDGAAHTEDQDNPYYTNDGFEAAHTGDIGFECGPAKLVDGLVEAPFHRLSILAPWMRVAGCQCRR
jgi:uncharacterized protein YkwD